MDNQMDIFDFFENNSNSRFPPVIEDLSNELNTLFSSYEKDENYRVWEHIPKLGYRYEMHVSINNSEYDFKILKLREIEKSYADKNLEVSILQAPSFDGNDKTRIFISTLWKDKNRAKNG